MSHNGNTKGGGKDDGAAAPKIGKLFYRIREACQVTGLGRSTLCAAMAAKRLAYFKVGRCTLIPGDALVRFVQGK